MSQETAPIALHVFVCERMAKVILTNQLAAIRNAGFEVSLVSDGSDDSAARAGFVVPFSRRVSPLADLRSLASLFRLFRHIRPAIVHTHTVKGSVYGLLAAKLAGVPVRVQTIHGLYRSRSASLGGSLGFAAEVFSAWLAHHSLSQNDEDARLLRKFGVNRSRVSYLGNGIDLERYRPDALSAARARVRSQLGLAPHHVALFCVARLVNEKGYPDLAAALATVHARNPHIRAFFVGPDEPSKSDRVNRLAPVFSAIAPFTQWLGFRSDIPELLAAADVFALASHREGFSRVLMEASAAGLPCVANDTRGCRSVIDHERTGLLVPMRGGYTHIEALATAIARLSLSELLRFQYGKAARDKALCEFDEQRVFADILSCYERELARVSGSAEPAKQMFISTSNNHAIEELA